MAAVPASRLYEPAKGAFLSKVAAELIGSELRTIQAEEGDIRPDAVVARAATPGTLLNEWDRGAHYFVWDDSLAGSRYREDQARQLIRKIVVSVEQLDGRRIKTRGFYHIVSQQGVRSYRPIEEIAQDEGYVKQVKDRFQEELIDLQRRYRAYLAFVAFEQSFGPVFDAIDAHLDSETEATGLDPRVEARKRHTSRRSRPKAAKEPVRV